MGEPIYLDYNATTPVAPEVLDAMLPYLRGTFGNPSSGHAVGRAAREGLDAARASVAAAIGALPEEIVFTSGGTEASNLAIRGAAAAAPPGRRRIVATAVEHPATERPCDFLAESGWEVVRVPVDGFGRASMPEMEKAIDARTALVTVIHASNEIGTLQPVASIAVLARRAGALLHVDAAQSLGKLPVDVQALGCDLLSIAGHKLYAPKGVGALYRRRGTNLRPVLLGAGQEGGIRPGTENVPYIVGLGRAAAMVTGRLATEQARLRRLGDRLHAGLERAVPGIALNGHPEERLPNTLNLRFPGISGRQLLDDVPEVQASTGSACHDGLESPSAVLLALGLAPTAALGAVRLSLGHATTEAEVDRAAALLAAGWARLARRSAA